METNHDLSLAKDALRQSVRAQLRALTPDQCAKWSEEILRRLMHDDRWANSGGAVALFSGFRSEPDLLPLLPWLKDRGIRAAFFAIEVDGLMSAYQVHGVEDLLPGKFGVLEPRRETAAKLNVSDLGVVLTPGLAFGRSDGARLGRGKGHYDRVFGNQECRALRVGVAFDVQVYSAVPAEPHDAAMQALVTETELCLIPVAAQPW